MNNRLRSIVREEINKFLEQLDVTGLEDITLKTPAPQLGRGYETKIENDKIIVLSDKFVPNKLYDYIIDVNGDLYVGKGHYKIAKKADKIKGAGEIKVNKEGKVTYLNNVSGHYEPTKQDLDNIANKFKEMNLFTHDTKIEKKF